MPVPAAALAIALFLASEQPAPKLNESELQLIEELNRLRRDPAGYAGLLRPLLSSYRGLVLHVPGKPKLLTKEGAKPVIEAIGALRSASPVPALRISPGLCRAARDHVRDIGPKGLVTHGGTDGSTPSKRANRYAAAWTAIGENISFGPDGARSVVINLVVDDGVPDRGHRRNLLTPEYQYVGVACGAHAIYRSMCVIDLAAEYQE